MIWQSPEIATFLAATQPYGSLGQHERAALSARIQRTEAQDGDIVFAIGDVLPGIFVIVEGEIELRAESGAIVSILGIGDSFGARALLRDGRASAEARAAQDCRLLLIPVHDFKALIDAHPSFASFFERVRQAGTDMAPTALAGARVADLMTPRPVTADMRTPIRTVAAMMREFDISSVLLTDHERLTGIVTARDLTKRALSEGLGPDTPVAEVMSPDPVTLDQSAIGADALNQMLERGVGHLPVLRAGKLVGIVTQTDLTRYQAMLSSDLIGAIAGSADVAGIADVVRRIPGLLTQLVGIGHRHDIVTRMVTDVGDAATRRLLRLAETKLGPPPVPYLWLACGSQGRQEQTGVSDQDNCLILDDALRPEDDAYFAQLAQIVCDGLDACGYYHCPGEMMATNPRWRQPLRVWTRYFTGWIAKPDPMAQMLASVMFDLRPIGGETALFSGLHTETLRTASANSIFVSHMVSNAVKHMPPLGLFRSFATIRSGEHKDMLDFKLNGVVPVVDLARIYAIMGRIEPVNTRARLEAAIDARIVSRTGGHDLLDAYDLIAETRLRHQAERVRAGKKPDNYMAPATLSDLERSHLRDAFAAVKTMQAALGHTRSTLS